MNAKPTCSDEILRVADVVHGHARALIQLHNKTERAQNSFASIIRNLFGSPVAFEELAREAVGLETTWREVLAEVAAAMHRLQPSITRRENAYLQLVQRYARANAAASAILAERQRVFFDSSKSAKRSTLTSVQTKELTSRYLAAVTKCQQLFEQLKYESFSFLSNTDTSQA